MMRPLIRKALSLCRLQQITLFMMTAVSVTGVSAEKFSQTDLLEQQEYRSDLEEVLVIGTEPEWRKNIDKQKEWRHERFEFLDNASSRLRMEWFPEYIKDERESYQGVRDRAGENPEFQLFKIKF